MTYPNSYHVTAGPRTEAKERKCVSQEDYIYGLFRASPDRGFTTDEIFVEIIEGRRNTLNRLYAEDQVKAYHRAGKMIISIRRAISNLRNRGLLIKTGQTRQGMSGDKNRVYVLSQVGKNNI